MNLKNKHVLVNMTAEEYDRLKSEATANDRTITNYLYLIIKKHLQGAEKQ